jgi:hypothetical protein
MNDELGVHSNWIRIGIRCSILRSNPRGPNAVLLSYLPICMTKLPRNNTQQTAVLSDAVV